ncbi:MAG: Gp19/Gp15/Gp42 family protein [Olegusella sp.]|nr:Gp19/Gp15/Gp42 family protein [Olegusella sp.]
MDAFASVDELQTRWRTLTETERPRAQEALLDVTAFITSLMAKSGVAIDPDDEVQSHNLMAVTCNVARRALVSSFDQTGNEPAAPYTEHQQIAGVFQERYVFANPLGDMYLTASEKSILGIGRQRVGTVRAAIGGD